MLSFVESEKRFYNLGVRLYMLKDSFWLGMIHSLNKLDIDWTTHMYLTIWAFADDSMLEDAFLLCIVKVFRFISFNVFIRND